LRKGELVRGGVVDTFGVAIHTKRSRKSTHKHGFVLNSIVFIFQIPSLFLHLDKFLMGCRVGHGRSICIMAGARSLTAWRGANVTASLPSGLSSGIRGLWWWRVRASWNSVQLVSRTGQPRDSLVEILRDSEHGSKFQCLQ
jgi:hypothetical protein